MTIEAARAQGYQDGLSGQSFNPGTADNALWEAYNRGYGYGQRRAHNAKWFGR